MFAAMQYRAKAVEYAARMKASQSPSESREFQNLERTYRLLAENAEWLAGNGQAMPTSTDDLRADVSLPAEEKQNLGRLGAAVMMRWNNLPAKIQRELFECATSLGNLRETARMKRQIACFLHQHKDDARNGESGYERRLWRGRLRAPFEPRVR